MTTGREEGRDRDGDDSAVPADVNLDMGGRYMKALKKKLSTTGVVSANARTRYIKARAQ